MGLTKSVLKRPVTVVMVILCLIVFGLQSVLGAKLELMPTKIKKLQNFPSAYIMHFSCIFNFSPFPKDFIIGDETWICRNWGKH